MPDAPSRPPPRKRLRRVAVGLGLGAAAAGAAIVAQRAAARRLRDRPDPERDVAFDRLPPEDLGPVRSFDGTEIAVRAAGPKDAPTLVFSHGVGLDMTTWHYQWTTLSDRYRCILFDHRAHGRSGEPPSGDYSVVAMGRDLRAVLDAAVPDGPSVLVGHSMGGMAILALAQAHPEEFGGRVSGVVLADTAASDVIREVLGGFGAGAARALRRLSTAAAKRVDAARALQRGMRRFGADLALLVAWGTNFGPDASPAQVEHVTRIAQAAPAEVWIHTLLDIVEIDLQSAIQNVTVPSLVVVGDRDLVTPKTSAQALRAALPDAEAIVITGAGHVSMMERHRVFNEVLERYVERALAERGEPAAARG